MDASYRPCSLPWRKWATRLTAAIGGDRMRVAVARGFIVMAAWALVPDKPGAALPQARLGVFAATCVVFFLAEMGDKTQIATVALAARYAAIVPVVIGTTLGMLVANVPVIFAGERLARKLPLMWLRRVAAA